MHKVFILVKKIVTTKTFAYKLMKPIFSVKFKHYLDFRGLCSTWEVLDEDDQRGVQVL